jgi:hypothetical protein
VNIALVPKKALKALCERKQARRDESQLSAPIKRANLRSTSGVLSTSTNSTNQLPRNKPIMAIEEASTNIGIRTMPLPNTPFVVDFKSKLEA